MVDVHSNGGKKRSPLLDLNQAFTKEDEEEEEQNLKGSSGPSWLVLNPQKAWLQLNEQDEGERTEHTSESRRTSREPEQQLTLTEKPFLHAVERKGIEKCSIFPHNKQPQDGLQGTSSCMTEQRLQGVDIWKCNSDATMDLTTNFSSLEAINERKDKPSDLNSPRNACDGEHGTMAHVQRSLSPISPPPERKSFSSVSPEQRLPESISEAAPQHELSPAKGEDLYCTPYRRHSSGRDLSSRRRREKDESLSPKTFSKSRRERSHSLSPAMRPSRGRRSRTRSPVPRRHRYSPPRSKYSPRGRHSPRRRSPISYRLKRRPWSPPLNRNTGLGKPGRNLFIAGFSFGTTERDLERKFSRYGRVRDVRIVRDKRSGDSRGFGFLSLDRDENADAAIRGLDQTEWNGRIVLVEKAKSPI
ncbi:hypothetical protein KP509_33G054100 [Ceratopteris richardii]|uniref:RRM domain-containing protein n=1 Tax=Ceratopteris richardii TaxID=49495 RepID=A0A8T2QRK9_CERRI|nr:hypothetical protein KP509_33G054100 [Ceratopteris richardii]